MVNGLMRWREYFGEYKDKYVLIGGAACNLLEEELEMNPRATKDLDLVLVVEALTPDFGMRLWDFIKDGNYESRSRGENEHHHEYYRFINPQDKSYPKQIELFARNTGILNLPTDAHIEPISIGEDLSSLSAILMDDDYYSFTIEHSRYIDEIHIASPETLICLKAKAYTEMLDRKEQGEQVDSRDIEKHKKDIFRLIAMLPQSAHFQLPGKLRQDIERFCKRVGELPNQDFFKSSGLRGLDAAQLMELLHSKFKHILYFLTLLLVSLSSYSQSEISFTNKVVFSKTGNMSGVRLVTLIPAPITNEYQDISMLKSNCGCFIDINAANKVLFYDGSFEDWNLEVFESFIYTTKKVRIDFSDKTNKNLCTSIDPDEYLGSDGYYINVNNNTIKQIGNQLWNQSTDIVDYAKRCYEYVASNFSYINGSWRSLDDIIQARGGECGDFTTLFVNLMRYKGIPARHNIGVWVNGGYHVWPDFYHEDYGWIPLDPTFKNSNPNGDYFGIYDGNLIILSQGLTTFMESDISVQDAPLQTFCYWYWYMNGSGDITAEHITSKDYQVDAIDNVEANDKQAKSIYSLSGIKQNGLCRGINIMNGKEVILKK